MQIIMCWVTLCKEYRVGKKKKQKNEKNLNKKFRWNEVTPTLYSLYNVTQHIIICMR